MPASELGHELVAGLSDFFVHLAGRVYDVGWPTGALTEVLAARHLGAPMTGLDVEPDMAAVAVCA